jgi:hypothetical protein
MAAACRSIRTLKFHPTPCHMARIRGYQQPMCEPVTTTGRASGIMINSISSLSFLAACCALGCSFRDFDYLKTNGHPGAGGAGQAGANGGLDAAEPPAADSEAGQDAGSGDSPARETGAFFGLVNPGFEQGYNGWTFDPPSAVGKYAFTQYPTPGAYTIEGQYELATWHGVDAYRIRIYQSFLGLENGIYTFKGYFNRGDGLNAVYVYASGCGGQDQQTNVPLTNSTQWIQVGIGGINVSDNRCEVGFVVDANATNWLNADAFSFERDPQ